MNIFQQVAQWLRQNGQADLAALVLRADAQALSICQALQSNNNLPALAQANIPMPSVPPSSVPVPGGGGCSTGSCGFPPAPPSGGCSPTGGSCGCGGSCGGNGAKCNTGNCQIGPFTSALCGKPTPVDPCTGAPVPVTVPPGGCPVAPSQIPACAFVGAWNCQAVDLDLAPCDIGRIERQEKLVTFTGTLAGPLADGAEIAVLIVPIGVGHDLCIEKIAVESIPAMGDATTLTIGEIEIQAERIYQDGNGNFVHAWDYRDPERPEYLGVTSSRCQCVTLCACVPAEGRVRIVFPLPEAVAMGATLSVTLWGRRCNWLLQGKTGDQKGCGPCPPCALCEHVELTNAEAGYTSDTLYAVV